MSADYAIEILGLKKQFQTTQVIKDLSFKVQKNHIVGFLGPNGAGKTTTMRMLVGLSKPSAGEIVVNGQKVEFGVNQTNAAVGYLPEMPSLYGWMKATEYLEMMINLYQLPKVEQRRDQLLKMVGLYEARNKRIASFSGGMCQRLGIAQALVNEPSILVLDEPVSALDPIGRKEVLNIIEGMRKDKTVLFSTHILSDVDRICDDVVIINHGKLVVSSSLIELKQCYAQPIVKVEFSSDPTGILDELQKQSWLKRYEVNGNGLKIWLNEEGVANPNWPFQFLAHQKLAVLHYGFDLPEVEDLFMDLLQKKEGGENE